MANTVITNAQMIYTQNGMPINLPLVDSYTTTGSRSDDALGLYVTNSWVAAYTGSVPDVARIWFRNYGPGNVQIATGSAGQGLLQTLSGTDWGVTNWTGSATLFAKSTYSASYIDVFIIPT